MKTISTGGVSFIEPVPGSGGLEIIWPERLTLPMDNHESFFMRDGGKLFFNKWYEEGDGADYRYWEETIVKDLEGRVTEVLPGDVMRMPNGELWLLDPGGAGHHSE